MKVIMVMILIVFSIKTKAVINYIITTPVVVMSGNTLTVKPGHELLFACFTGITVKPGGHFVALETKKQPVAFTSAKDTAAMGAAFDWVGITIEQGGAAELRYSLIIYSTTGITAKDSGGIILNQCIFSGNGQWNLSVAGKIHLPSQTCNRTATRPPLRAQWRAMSR